jgi:hypothetical protein
MATHALRERLARDLGQWLTDGLISKTTHDLLAQRYQARSFGIGQAAKYVGIAGGLFACFGLLGLIGALSGSMAVAAFLLLATGSALTAAGIRLARDPLGRYGFSSKVVLALGVTVAGLGVGTATSAAGFTEESVVMVTGLVVLPVIGWLAYRFANIFLLILGLLGCFHWIGSWTAMFGRSTYELAIQDPRWMSAAALLAVAVGVLHELRLRDRTGRFFQAYQAVGLVYLNLSLLLLTFEGVNGAAKAVAWIVVLALAAIGQILVGARLHNGLLTGFGVTAFAVNLYTRYFEHFWESTHAGVFFLLGGVSLLGAGIACEVWLKRARGAST